MITNAPYYLSQIVLSPELIYREKITDTYSLHRVVYDQFPRDIDNNREGRSLPLWDECYSGSTRKLIVLSSVKPKTAEGLFIKHRTTIEFPYNVLEQQNYVFKITVNPVRQSNSKAVPIRDRAAITDWFFQKAEEHGFEVVQPFFEIKKVYADIFTKKNQKVVLNKARIQGALRVTDKQLFTASVLNGIGRAKSFGCGLLQVIPQDNI